MSSLLLTDQEACCLPHFILEELPKVTGGSIDGRGGSQHHGRRPLVWYGHPLRIGDEYGR